MGARPDSSLLRFGAALLGLVSLAGCSAPPDALWHEDLEVQITKWDIVEDELRLLATLDAPQERFENSTLEVKFRVNELRVANAAIDVPNGTFKYELRPDGSIAVEFRARLVQSGLATERSLTVDAKFGLTFRGARQVASAPDWLGKTEGTWTHPEVPGLKLTLTSWDLHAVSVSVETPPGGTVELIVLNGGRVVPTEPLRVAKLIRLAFDEPCPKGAQLAVVWQPVRRCRAHLAVRDLASPDQ
ncbi:MAG: hypothetical protein JKY65_31290 [Planctomycetes bacterium]|nr:hypothetical protein [Planctomycetota bacterium]